MFTFVCYAVISTGGFVKDIGRGDMTLTLSHFASALRRSTGAPSGCNVRGSAWDSLFTTIEVAAVAAPLTALIGLLAAYVIARHRFAGRATFEFLTLVSFAIPGTVIGVSYIVAFNVAPLELTGGMAILVLCFVFRNMPVGVRAGHRRARADRQDARRGVVDAARLDAAHAARPSCCRCCVPRSSTTLVFSFTRAMTAVSAVIFLATAQVQPVDRLHHQSRRGAANTRSRSPTRRRSSSFMLVVLLVMQQAGRRGAAGTPHRAGRDRGNLTMTQGIARRVVFERVTKRYGDVTAVDDVSFTVEPGELCTLLGPSGCGKTTTLRMVAGLESVTGGRILIGGEDVTLRARPTSATSAWCSSRMRCSRT